MKSYSLAILALTALASASLAQEPAALYQENCAECHGGQAKGDDRVAPPTFAVKNHYKDLTSKEAFVTAVTAFVTAPSEEAARMPGAIGRFGLMPELGLDAETIEAIAGFIYDTDFQKPGWYDQHYQEEHGELPSE